MNYWEGYTEEELKKIDTESIRQQIRNMAKARKSWRSSFLQNRQEKIEFLEKEINKLTQELRQRKEII